MLRLRPPLPSPRMKLEMKLQISYSSGNQTELEREKIQHLDRSPIGEKKSNRFYSKASTVSGCQVILCVTKMTGHLGLIRPREGDACPPDAGLTELTRQPVPWYNKRYSMSEFKVNIGNLYCWRRTEDVEVALEKFSYIAPLCLPIWRSRDTMSSSFIGLSQVMPPSSNLRRLVLQKKHKILNLYILSLLCCGSHKLC